MSTQESRSDVIQPYEPRDRCVSCGKLIPKDAGGVCSEKCKSAAANDDSKDGERVKRLEAQVKGLMNCLAESQREVERLRKVELVFQNESGCGYSDPFAAVYVNGVQYDKVWAYIAQEQGADGGYYSVIKFRRTNPAPPAAGKVRD